MLMCASLLRNLPVVKNILGLSAVTQVVLPLDTSRVIPLLVQKENHVPLSDPGIQIYQVLLTLRVLHQLMPFNCPPKEITPSRGEVTPSKS